MRVLLSTCGTRGDVEPLVALAVRLRALGVEVRMCAPPDFVERLAEVGVPMVSVGRPVHAGARGGRPGPEAPGLAADELIAVQFDRVPVVAEGCDAVVAGGALPVAVAVRSVAEKLGIPYVYAVFDSVHLRSPYDPRPRPRPRGDGEPPAPDVTDPQALRDLRNEALYRRFGGPVNSQRALIGLPPVDNIVDYACTDQPWLAADPVLAPLRRGQDAVQTGAWILPDERPLSAELEAFLAAGSPPVYVGFGSIPGTADAARVAIEAVRAQGRRVVLSRGWADLALPDDRDDCFAVGEANVQVLFGRMAAVVHPGNAGTTHVVTRAGVPQVVIHEGWERLYLAERVAELGIGVALDGSTPTFDSMSAALATALAPETRARATAVGGTIRTDGATVAAELLLDVVSREKPSVPA